MEHFYKNIQGWFRYQEFYLDAIQRASITEPSHFVEIGCWKGRSTAFLCVEIINSGKPIKFDVIDTFRGSDGIEIDPDVVNGTLKQTFLNNLASVKDAFTAYEGRSYELASMYADESLDFIQVDGDHSYEGVLKDLQAFYPKLKVGGIICGDDYLWKGVNRAVKEYFNGKAVGHTANNKANAIWRMQKV